MTAPSACPACGAALRPGAPWCTLCYADLRPQPPEPEPEPEPEPPVPVLLPAGLEVEPALVPAAAPTPMWPCTGCGTGNSFERDTCSSCGAGFLAGARDDAPLLELPLVGDLTRLGRGQRFGLAAGVVLAFLALVVLVGLAFG